MKLLAQRSILLIISGGIAAYKSLELIRLIRKQGGSVRAILTAGGEQFVTPLSVASLTEHTCYTDLFSLKNETEMGHIRLSREADLIVIAPASADILAKMAHGLTNDLATTTLLAADKDVLIAPAMNHKMWEHPATKANLELLKARGILTVGPDEGDMACGEFGFGRMSEPQIICDAIINYFSKSKPLSGKRAIVTSGPTFEAIDPVRFIGNRSSGKQGHAIAKALADQGADVTLITGPVAIAPPPHVRVINVESAQEMLAAVQSELPSDIAICAAAVSDWRIDQQAEQKIKKAQGMQPPVLNLTENPDILATIAQHKNRPTLVIGFAAETENLVPAAKAKLERKACDWIIANNVKDDNVFGSDNNSITFITKNETDEWQSASKEDVARKLVHKIIQKFEN
jgi:phosphopantothenoylcysteine decarboxylase/phosphopantothenate--cysteine ligase